MKNPYILENVVKQHNMVNEKTFKLDDLDQFEYFKYFGQGIKEILKNTDKNKNLLDVGCGAGWFGCYLERQNITQINYSGMDSSQLICNLAVENYPSGYFFVNDILSYTTEKKWDIVSACGVLETMQLDEWKHFLYQISKLTNDWMFIHKFFLTENNEKTQLENRKVYSYNATRLFLNEKEFLQEIEKLNFSIQKNWNNNNHSILLRKI